MLTEYTWNFFLIWLYANEILLDQLYTYLLSTKYD